MRTPFTNTESKTKAVELVIQHDVANEQVVIAAAMADDEVRRRLVRMPIDVFQTASHQQAWSTFQELERKQLGFDFATLQTLTPGLDVGYLSQLHEARPDVPVNLDHHVKTLLWDKARASSITGPVALFLDAIKNPKESPERVKALAKAIGGTFDGYEGRSFLRDSEALVHEQIEDLKSRRAGFAVYTYGIPSLDKYEDGSARMVPGAKPEQVTIITGLSGSGKTTFLAQMILGIARDYHKHFLETKQRKRVLFGAWETQSGPMLELMASMSLRLNRTKVSLGNVTDEEIEQLRARQLAISEYVKFMQNPFQRVRGERRQTNDDNLDKIHQYIEDTGADIFVADLLQRAFVQKDPDQEETALFRFQAIMQQTHCHAIVCHQIRLKDVEQRADKRPTREGMKGSSAWTEIADTILGVHRPALWAPVPDTTLQILVLKQRWGKWPLAVEFDSEPDIGVISNGRSIEYNRALLEESSEHDAPVDDFLGSKRDAMKQRSPNMDRRPRGKR